MVAWAAALPLITKIGVPLVGGGIAYYYIKSKVNNAGLSPAMTGALKGALDALPFVVPGAALVWASKDISPRLQTLAGASGIGLIGLGAYKWYDTYKDYSSAEGPKPGELYTVSVQSPYPNEEWSCNAWWHDIKAHVRNLNPVVRNLILGCSVQGPYSSSDGTPLSNFQVTDLGTYSITVLANGSGVFEIPITLDTFDCPIFSEFVYYEVKCALWNTEPKPGCEDAGTCERIADSGWIRFKIYLWA